MKNTILVTGGTGYIGSWVTKQLLDKGHTVRLTLRDKNKREKYIHIEDIATKSEGALEIWEADLLKEGSYEKAAEGAEAVIHMASPFTLRFKDAQKDLVDPAVKGTRNVLSAANKSGTVKKVVLTSSVAAVHGDNIDMLDKGLSEFSEEHFNTTSSVSHQPYSYSKVEAEQEAWNIHDAQSNWKLVVINPSFVLGPSLTANSDSESLAFINDMLSGKYHTGAPDLTFGYVDVRDVATAHLLALEKEDAEGRHILAERTASVMDVAEILKKQFGKKYKLPMMKAPKWLLTLIAPMFGLQRSFIRRNVGYPITLNTTKSKQELGLPYTPLEQTLKEMVEQMEKQK